MIPTMFFAQDTFWCKTVISQQIRARILKLDGRVGWEFGRVNCMFWFGKI